MTNLILVKPKDQAAQDLRDGAKAHAAARQPDKAWWFNALACAVETMDEDRWQAYSIKVDNAVQGINEFAATMAAQKGGAA